MKVPFLDLARAYEKHASEFDARILEVARSGAYVLGRHVSALEDATAASPMRCTWLLPASASGRATRSSRARLRLQPRSRRSNTSARRRCWSISTPAPTTSTLTGSKARLRTRPGRSCLFTCSACRPTCSPSWASPGTWN